MNWKIIIKYVLLILVAGLILFGFTANRIVDKIYGGHTKEVDPQSYNLPNLPFAITNVNVLLLDASGFIPNQTVHVNDGLIVSIDSLPLQSGDIKTIDGKGRYLIPGLIDSHVHLFKSPNDLLLYVANGVTHVREMIGEEQHLQWKKEIENGRIGPELYVTSPRFGSFDLMQGLFMFYTQGFTNVNTVEEASQKVIAYHNKGYDGIKIYSHLNKACYQAISNVTDSLGIDMIGHIPFNIGLPEVWNGNQREIAHFEEIMNALNREYGYFRNEEKEAFFKYIDEKSDSIAFYLKQNNIAVSSTLWGMKSLYRQKTDLQKILKEIKLEYVNPGITEGHKFIPQGGLGWLPGVNRVRFPEQLTEEEKKGRGDYWLIYAEACERVGMNLYQRGIEILAGTDANLSIKVPGFSLHDELTSLNEMGMTPSEVLRSAILTPAKWLKTNTGQIKEGYKANLVILNKNPLDKIEHTKAINSVILNGRILDRAYLDNLLLLVKQANDSSRKIDITQYLENAN